MGKSDEITKRLITGETEDELIKSGYNRTLVHRERNKIKLIKELTQIANNMSQDNLNIKKLLIYTRHNTLEIAWGTLIGIFGLAAAFKGILQNGASLFLLFAGPIFFIISLTNLNRSIDKLDPPKIKTSWWITLKLAVLGPIGLLVLFNGIGGIFGLEFLELLKPLINYPVNSKLWPAITIVLGVLLLVVYFLINLRYNQRGKRHQIEIAGGVSQVGKT